MALVLRDVLELSEDLRKVVGCWIRHFIFKIEIDALGSRNRNGVLALVLFYELPKGICAELLLETDSHHFILTYLRPLDTI